MDVLFLSPNYPPEMPQFTRGLAEVGARVYGVGDTPKEALDPVARAHLHDYLQVRSLMDEADVMERCTRWMRGRSVDRVLCSWEPLVLLAARLRERWGIPGMSLDQVNGFRDKQIMKERVAAAGLRVPHSARVRSARDAWEAAERIGFPLIIKPIAGAGSADTFRVDNAKAMDDALVRLTRVPEAIVEEFIEGEEYTYDTICINGKPVYENVVQYMPRPLIMRTQEWISPIQLTVRDLERPDVRPGIELGRGVLSALGMGTGYTHMEWYLTRSGEAIFGEIACRNGGACLVDQMNFTSDIDLYREWARASCWDHFEAVSPRLYNVACIFKRARGRGRIQRIDGKEAFFQKYGSHVVRDALLPVGAMRRDWTQTLLSDGYLLLRHPDWNEALKMAQTAAHDIQLSAQ
ncbi:MAG TPA: ATP-grasp domain-containing protein [Myxococcota bacterium]|nr:ATP-grasp domain-containing protein [Myxococcota bacterium]